MANSKLTGKLFQIPEKILKSISIALKKFSDKTKNAGYSRAISLLQNKQCTYEQLKRIKNYFDYVDFDNYDEIQYLLNGGELMQKWVDFTLEQARSGVKGTKYARRNSGMDNQFRKDAEDNFMPATPNIRSAPSFMSTSDLMEEVNKIKNLIEKLN